MRRSESAPVAYVTRPSVEIPGYEISTADIVDDILRTMPEDTRAPSAAVVKRLASNLQIDTRSFVAPLKALSRPSTITERNNLAQPLMARMGTDAAQTAIKAAGLTNTDIDVIITSHSTTPATPGLDVHIINELQLRPDIRRMPATQLGCVGGAHALSWAAELVDAKPELRILIVISEALSTVYRSDKNDPAGIIYRLLFGDGAAACIVSSQPQGACLEITRTWQHVVPGTTDSYTLHTEPTGLHFTSEKWAPDGITHLMPPLWTWLRQDDKNWTPEVVIAHPGGPRILEDTLKGLNCTPQLLAHSWESLRTRGNLGGVAILDILARTADATPRHHSPTLLLGIGPGLAGAATQGQWHNPTNH
ncbi:PhlD [Streptomyces venezuelae]|nr:PhlD [Streptomyces venezuelae]